MVEDNIDNFSTPLLSHIFSISFPLPALPFNAGKDMNALVGRRGICRQRERVYCWLTE